MPLPKIQITMKKDGRQVAWFREEKGRVRTRVGVCNAEIMNSKQRRRSLREEAYANSLVALIRRSGIDYSRTDVSDLQPPPAAILHHETMHVRLESVVKDLGMGPGGSGFEMHLREDLEDVTPPHQRLWMEMVVSRRRWGVYVERGDVSSESPASLLPEPRQQLGDGPYRHIVHLLLFTDIAGMCVPVIQGDYLTDRYGQIGYAGATGHWWPEIINSAETQATISLFFYVALEAIVRMNTQGTEVREVSGRSLPHPRPLENRSCVWREITIRPVRKGVVSGDEGQEKHKQDAVDRREETVRAHRKDYRKGKGLFGRVRSLVWFAEHKRGNPELGCIIPEYRIE